MVEVRYQVGGRANAVKISALAVSEDLAAWRRANDFLDRLSVRLGAAATIEKCFWRLSLMRTPLLQEQVAVEASHADLIILSLGSSAGVLEDLEKWIGRWLDHKEDRPYRLGVLQHYDLERSYEARTVAESLEQIAAREGIDFSCCNTQSESYVAKTLAKLAKQLSPSFE